MFTNENKGMKIEQKLVSVIVPCYKVERYLPTCVDSLLRQTYRNLEIFLVDDGSPDGSGALCDTYAQRDGRIRVIHKANGGLSDARNVAIDAARGDYIVFVDSDDYVADDYVETLYHLAADNGARIGVALHRCFDEGTHPEPDTRDGKTTRVMGRDEALADMFYQRDFDTAAWAKIYERSLFDGIRYPKGWLFEDLPTTYRLMMKTERVAFTDYKSYYYLIRKDSIEGAPFKPAKYESCMKIVGQLSRDRSLMPNEEVKKALDCRVVSLLFHILLDVPESRTAMRRTLVGEIKRRRWGVMLDGKARKKTRLACLLSLFGTWAVDLLASKGKTRK